MQSRAYANHARPRRAKPREPCGRLQVASTQWRQPMSTLSPRAWRFERWLALLCACMATVSACSSDDAAAPAPPNVTVVKDLRQTFDCTTRNCLAKYRSFVADHAEFAHPRPFETVRAELAGIEAEPVPPVMTLSQEELRAQIIDALNIGFMLEGLDARPLRVTIFAESETAGITSQRLIFADPLVGEFDALQLEPSGSDPL